MRKLLALLAFVFVVQSCTFSNQAETIVTCPCKVVGVGVNEEEIYRIKIVGENGMSYLVFNSRYKYELGEIIR